MNDHDTTQYKLGSLDSKLTNVEEEVAYLRQDISEIKRQLEGWQNRAAGAVAVLGVIGSVVLYLGHDLFVVIKTKLGF